jgi:molybdopterin/thiamine biosynthesis adenylyltransferase
MEQKVVIVGVGALGSHLVQALRNEPIKMVAIDHDRVEMKNVASQFHPKGTVNKKKTEALRGTMNFLYGRRIDVVGHKLTADNVTQLLGGADLLVDCLDNGEARRLVQGFARAEDVPCLHGALAADGGFGRVVWTEDFVVDDEDVAGAATCEEGEFLPFIQVVAALQALAVQQFVASRRKVGYSISPAGVEKI